MNNLAEGKHRQNPQPSSGSVRPPSRGNVLWLKIGLVQRLLNAAAQQFWSHPALPGLFPGFLLELYSLVSCSVPLMNAACQRALEIGSGDPLAAKTAEYLRRHIDEEAHHDEWLRDDLVACGMDRARLHGAPSANIASLVGSQYCWIRHAHPAALFGYLAVIEGNPPLAEHLKEIQAQTGYPPEAFRCLHKHSEEDVEHLRELREAIAELPLTAEHETLITMSAFATVEGLIRILQDLAAVPSRFAGSEEGDRL